MPKSKSKPKNDKRDVAQIAFAVVQQATGVKSLKPKSQRK